MWDMDIVTNSSSLPVSFTGFCILYVLAYFVIFRSWPRKLRPVASSCFISLAHGSPAAFLACRAILLDPGRDFHTPNTQIQSAVLDYSVAYFLVDLLHYIVFFPSDVLFIGHHVATLFVFLTCRYVVYHGAFAILVLLFLAEVTSFLQNVWTLARTRRSDVKFAAKLYDSVSPLFYTVYSVVRGLLGPYFVYKMSVFYLSGDADGIIPKWAWISWLLVIGMAIAASIMWISNLWVEFYRERTKQDIKKVE